MIDKTNSQSVHLTDLLELFATLYILENQDKDKALGKTVSFLHQLIWSFWAERAETVFGSLDLNADEEISKAEFVESCLKDRELRKALGNFYIL